jgi:ABC-type spermidine/putrescine transport system permease subunit I
MTQISKEQYQSGGKLIWLQVHNIIPILLAFIMSVMVVASMFYVFTQMQQEISQQNEVLFKQHQAITEDRESIKVLINTVKELELETKVTPTPTVRRGTVTPTPGE